MAELFDIFKTSLGIYNVKHYGAAGDGAADDTAEIQAAITAAEAAGGGVVFLPAGTYKVTSLLRIKVSNITLEGCGEASVIMASGDYGNIIGCYPDSTPTQAGAFVGHRFRRFRVDSSTNRTSGSAIYGSWTHNAVVEDVRVGTDQFGRADTTPVKIFDALTFENQSRTGILSCQINHKNVGVKFHSAANVFSLGGNGTIGSNNYNGMIDGNTTILGDQYYTNSKGIWIAGGTGGVQINQVAMGFQDYGIYVSGTNREVFVQGGFPGDDIGIHGFYVESGAKLGKIIIQNGWNAGCGRHATGHGLYVPDGVIGESYGTATPLEVIITGGTYYSNTGYGIYIGTGEVCFSNVKVYSNTGGGIVLGPNVTAYTITGGKAQGLTDNSSATTKKIKGVLGLNDLG